MIEHLSQALPLVGVIAAACAFLGWSMHGLANKPEPAKAAKPAPAADKGQQDRAKNLEAQLEKSKAAHKTLKAELDKLQEASVSKTVFDATASDLDAARKSLETEGRRVSALEADLKKSQEAIRGLNAKVNDADKAQKARTFTLENELSKAREQLALLQGRPDDSAALTAEIERLRESVATTTRFSGELRKREAAAVEALQRAEARVAELSDPSRAAPVSKKIGPVVESNRIAAAKAEVLRLVEMNKKKEASAVVESLPAAGAPAVAAAAVAIVGETPVVAEPAPAIVEKTSADAPSDLQEHSGTSGDAPSDLSEHSGTSSEAPLDLPEHPGTPGEATADFEEAAQASAGGVADLHEPAGTSAGAIDDIRESLRTSEGPAVDPEETSGTPAAAAEETPAPKKPANGELFALE